MRSYLPLIPLLAGLTACGMKGDLYMPEATGMPATPAAVSPAGESTSGEPPAGAAETEAPTHSEDPDRRTIPPTPAPAPAR